MGFGYIKKEWKRLGSLSLFGVGAFLIGEHIFTYGYISLGDFLGHEWIGIILCCLGLFFANKSWKYRTDGSRIKYALEKIKFLTGGKNGSIKI